MAARKRAKTQAATSPACDWETQFTTARDSAVALLESAHDRASGTEIYWQLTGIAARLLAAEMIEGSPSQQEISGTFYSVLALINASQLGDEDIDDMGLALVREAHDIVFLLATGEPNEVSFEYEHVRVTQSLKKAQATSASTPQACCHSPAQCAMVFGEIATRANTLRHYLARTEADAVDLGMVSSVVDLIGLLADEMDGARVVGSAAEWTIGLEFRAAARTGGAA